jgi:hypothetical protein
MSLINKIYQKCCIMQWGIGFTHGSIEEVIQQQKIPGKITWLPLKNSLHFIADPFIFRNLRGNINLLFEDFSIEKDGILVLNELSADYKILQEKVIWKTSSHLSYPLVWKEGEKIYIIPESHQQNKVSCFEYNEANDIIENEKVLLSQALLDSTIVHENGKYWLFATLGDGNNDNKQLHLFFADNLFGPFQPHPANPIKDALDGSRPAGSIIRVGKSLYRPAQNCSEYYGKSITMQKIETLTETQYAESTAFLLEPSHDSPFKSGLHTINSTGDGVIVIDGIRFLFRPFTKLRLLLKNKFGN